MDKRTDDRRDTVSCSVVVADGGEEQERVRSRMDMKEKKWMMDDGQGQELLRLK